MLKFIKISKSIKDKLFFLFKEINEDVFFKPHPFTLNYCEKICNIKGRDLYAVLMDEDKIIGYGLLRGWDEGYEVPFLGIYIAKKYRKKGYSTKFMKYLHLYAQMCGASKVCLKVYKDNFIAQNLYKKLNYTFEKYDNNQLLGTKGLE